MKSSSLILIIVSSILGSGEVAWGEQYKLPWWHPSLQYVAEELLAAPPGHPLLDDDEDFQGFIESYTDEGHRWFDGDDGFVYAPWGLPSNHPGLDRFFESEEVPYGEFPIVYFDHPNIHEAYRTGRPLPRGHPSVMGLLDHLLPSNHPDIYDLFQQPRRLPEWHIDISMIIDVEELPRGYATVAVFFDHPNVDENYMMGNPQPKDHPSIEWMLMEYLPPNHPPNLDEMMMDPNDYPLPFGHPSLNSMVLRVDGPAGSSTLPTTILEDAPEEEMSIDEVDVYVEDASENPMIAEEEGLQSGSPTPPVMLDTAMSIEVLPTDDLPFSVFGGHPALVEGMTLRPFKHHPTVHHLWQSRLPPDYDHPNIDDLIEKGFTLPDWHPSIGHMIVPRDTAVSPGSLLCYALSALFAFALVLRNYRHWRNSHRTNEKLLLSRASRAKEGDNGSDGSDTLSSCDGGLRECAFEVDAGVDEDCSRIERTRTMSTNIEHEFDLVSLSSDNTSIPPPPPPYPPCDDEGVEVDVQSQSMFSNIDTAISLSRLDRRHHTAMEINRRRREIDEEAVSPTVMSYQEKRNTRLRYAWIRILGKRAWRTDSSNGEVAFYLFYLVLNSLAVGLSPYGLDVGFGSLAAGNIVFLVVSAIKNSVFTWFLGMAFDQIIVYHQFIGRVTVVASFVHSCFYFDRLVEFMSDRVYKTGFIALMFGIFITISSLNWIRRKYFNAFYWSHLAFVGFIVCVYLHARGARPFVLAAVASYAVDKVLHMVWTQLPRKTMRIEPAGERGKTTFVRVGKTPLNQLLGRNTVGQWVVVNFPELSLTEWHPFSVASGPSQPFIDLYIRALGNHTKRIAQYSEKCASENRQALIRVDGPYGNLTFNYRRYGSLVLVGGGIGITPIISIIKDIYEKSEVNHVKKTSHCMNNVHLIWIMPFEADAALFLDQLLIYRELSVHDPSLPLLEVSVHITREESMHNNAMGPIFYSKPDFPMVMDDVKRKAEIIGASSILVFACGPGSMVNRVWDASMKKNSKRIRVDFHHESFAY